MFHGLGLELIRLLLHFDHLLVLLALLLKSFSLACITIRLVILIESNGCFLVLSVLRQLLGSLPFFFGPLSLQIRLLVAGIQVTLAHFHNFDGLFLGILDFFPCLKKNKRSQEITAHHTVLRKRQLKNYAAHIIENVLIVRW